MRANERVKKMFRFQIGAIKSVIGNGGRFHSMSFDSKLVRLKAKYVVFTARPRYSFDSKLVRLKEG